MSHDDQTSSEQTNGNQTSERPGRSTARQAAPSRPAEFPDIPFHPHRSPVYATGGMIATSQPSATLAGIRILSAGGNAVDAAVAAAAVLAVTEPTGTGIGGDCFALCFAGDGGPERILALNGSGRAPAALNLELLRSTVPNGLPPFHAHTVTVPGAVAGWCDLVERAGSLPLGDILAPAIELARNGFAVAPKTAYHWASAVDDQLRGRGEDFLIGGRAPHSGEIFRNPALAGTLEGIAEKGRSAFYRGRVAEAIVRAVRDAGGVLELADLAEHRSTWDQPIATDVSGRRVYQCPPNSQGLTALLALDILSELDDLGGSDSVDRAHLIIESLRLAFADARRYIADPAFVPVPTGDLLARGYAAQRAAMIDRRRARVDPVAGSPFPGSDTVYLSAVDGAGNACSFIQSNYMGFGTGIAPAETGFTLHNRGLNFSLDRDHRNALGPGKRPFHTLMPGLVTTGDDDSVYACFGVMGAFMQPQGHVQVLLALLEDGVDAQAALDRPRLCLEPDGDVAVEEGIDSGLVRQLADRGHDVHTVRGHERALFGRGQIITRDPQSGVLCGGSDLRGDGCAMGC